MISYNAGFDAQPAENLEPSLSSSVTPDSVHGGPKEVSVTCLLLVAFLYFSSPGGRRALGALIHTAGFFFSASEGDSGAVALLFGTFLLRC